MNACWLCLSTMLCGAGIVSAQTTSTQTGTNQEVSPATVPETFDYDSWMKEEMERTRTKYALWSAEKNRAQKMGEAIDLVKAAVDTGNKDVVEEVLRDGGHRRQLVPPTETSRVFVQTLFKFPEGTTPADNSMQYEHRSSPIFRRINATRFEVWTSTDGWLFDGKGRLLHHVRVPRRDGSGREWFGAFLPSGRWITTDLWNDDRQLNCFGPNGQWLWELRGAEMVSDPTEAGGEEPIRWARSSKTGDGWVTCPGFDNSNYFLVSSEGHAQPVKENNPWGLTFPRAMQAKGTYLELQVPSDDGREFLVQNSAGHGNWIGFPSYRVGSWPENVVIPDGDAYFGFMPNSHEVWIESNKVAYGRSGEVTNEAKKIFFLNTKGNYEAEIEASWLGDAADGKHLLVQDRRHRVIAVSSESTGQNREFCSGNVVLIPLTLFDDLKLGFFFDSAAHGIVLSRW